MNTVNDLIEKGFVQAMEGHVIALHPMVQEVAVEEIKPSITSCRTLLESLQQICLRHGEEVPYYKQLFQTIETIINLIDNDDMPFCLRFVEDVFPYMEKFHYAQGMDLVLKHLTELMKDDVVGSISDRALLMDYRACCEKKPDKAIKLEKDAIAMLAEITSDNALLANLHANLGGMYRQSGKYEQAKQYMEQGIKLLEQFGLVPYHDSIPQITNYAVLLTEMGQPDTGLSALRKLSRVIREYNSDQTIDYASVQEAMGNICLTIGDVQQATSHFQKAMAVYEMVFEAEPDMIEAKKQALLGTYTQAGLYMGSRFISK